MGLRMVGRIEWYKREGWDGMGWDGMVNVLICEMGTSITDLSFFFFLTGERVVH